MAKREIITLPDPLLRKPSAAVERVDDEINRLIDDMLETMYAAPGLGLAGVQVAVPRRVLVFDVADREKGEAPAPQAMINPEVLWRSETMRSHEEGCLSIPEVYAEIARPAEVRVRYIDRKGRVVEQLCSGLMATVVQHEIDHLDGKLFIDYLSRLKRDRVVKKFIKAHRAKASAV